jgi:Domain of unknown function (DUF5666)
MPEDDDEGAGGGARDEFDEPDDLDDVDAIDDIDDFDDEPDGWARGWPAPGYPPADPGYPPGRWHRGGGTGARRGRLLTLTAVVAAAAGFGVVAAALHDVTGSAAAASATPSSSAPAAGGPGAPPSSGAGNGTHLAPLGGGVQSLPPGATERLEIGGPVTAVSATSITLDGGGQAITAAVTRATTITGKATSIGGIKVGDLVSASITGADGKLTADSIQDPASLPSGAGQ